MKHSIPFCVLALITFISCSSSKVEPQWITDKEAVYPSGEYICFVGDGDSKQKARDNAVSDMSLYFKSTVTTSLSDEFSSLTEDDKTYIKQTVTNNTQVTSSFTMSGLQYEDYYSKKQNLWYSAAYISRSSAWKQYVSEVESSKNAFYAIYNEAAKKDALRASLWYAKASEKGQEFLEKLVFAHVINPSKEKFTYNQDREVIASIPLKIQKCLEQVTLKVNTEGDFEDIINSCLIADFKDLGFSVLKSNSSSASYTAQANVNMNSKSQDDLLIAYPSIELHIFYGTEDVYSYTTFIEEKTVSYQNNVLYRTALNKLAKKINSELKEDFTHKYN